MKLKPLPLEIPPDNPFSVDKLNRKESAEILSELIGQIEVPFVLAVDYQFGTGKTTFVIMWRYYLKSLGYPCIHFNAWETDYTEDPLIAFIGEIQSGLETGLVKEEGADKAKKLLDKAKDWGATLVKRTIPLAIRLGTGGIISLDPTTEQGIADLAADWAKEKIDQYGKDKETVQGFKDTLRQFVKELGSSSVPKPKPLVIFVDELDRCRPIYAIQLLERIKHFFNIEGLIFILSMDKAQIGESIKSVYGKGMDIDGYLRRFIDLDYHLPEPPPAAYPKFLFEQFNFLSLLNNINTGEGSPNDLKEQLIEMFTQLSAIFGLSLRVQEQCFTQLAIVVATTKSQKRIYLPFLAALLLLKAKDEKLYEGLVKGNVEIRNITDFIGQNAKGKEFLYENGSMDGTPWPT